MHNDKRVVFFAVELDVSAVRLSSLLICLPLSFEVK
jgi:hypothetical protein